MKGKLSALVILLSLFLYGCSSGNPNKFVNTDFEKYINKLGYTIQSSVGETEHYTLTKEKLTKSPYDVIWGLQNVDCNKYINKEIHVYKFNVTKNNNAVILCLIAVDNKAIGGYSYPYEDYTGSYLSQEGKSLEDITGLDFQQWQLDWQKKIK